jgi:serine/threonine-protein kinase RIO1
MANMMAKTEFKNLQILQYFNVSVPNPLQYRGGFAFSMDMVPFQSSEENFEPAPILKEINLSKYINDPGSFLEETLDQIEIMFKQALMVHGDLSEYNILVSDEKPVIIDVSQTRLYNNKTFTTTPVRIRLDDALEVVIRDLKMVMNHFETKYKIFYDFDDILAKMFSDLPTFAKERDLISNLDFSQKSSRTMWMETGEINSFTNVRMTGKDRKMQNLFKSLSYD